MARIEELSKVIAESQIRQNYARELNLRAGKEVFKIMSFPEMKEWLLRQLKGARSVAEITDLSALLLPEPDPALAAEVIASNPDSVVIDGKTIAIEYGADPSSNAYARARVTEAFACSTRAEAIVLPGGRVVKICCGMHSANSFRELAAQLEQDRIANCWNDARSEHESLFAYRPTNAIRYLALVGKQVVVAYNSKGEPILGFTGLMFYSGSSAWRIFLAATSECAEEETQKALKKLLEAFAKEILFVPEEELWYQSGAYFSRSLTQLGRKLSARFEELLRENTGDATVENIVSKIEKIRCSAEAAKQELGGEHLSVSQLIRDTEQVVRGKISALANRRSLVEEEIAQISAALSNANGFFISGAFGDAKASCEMAAEAAQQLEALCTSRSPRKTVDINTAVKALREKWGA